MKIAIVQWSPAHLDLARCLEKAEKAISESSQNNADLVVFGETWFSGYPSWLDYCTDVAHWDHPPLKKVFARMLTNSLRKESPEMLTLQSLASEHEVSLVIGANEVDPETAKGTIFNSIFCINEKGELVNHHRKLVPTFTEKLLYNHGDGAGLRSSKLSGVNVTASVCWEHWMPLTRQALHDTNEEVHIALWPKVHEMHQVASRQYAFEGRCYVIAAGQMFHSSSFPEELTKPENLQKEDRWVLNGGSCVVGPNGFHIVEPTFDKETIIYADLDIERVREESLTLDVSGHYQRNDVFELSIKKKRS